MFYSFKQEKIILGLKIKPKDLNLGNSKYLTIKIELTCQIISSFMI